MLIYSGTKKTFIEDVLSQHLTKMLEDMLLQKMHRTTSYAERKSWQNSMQYMFMVMSDGDIPNDSGVAIEYNVPLTAKRVDFIVSGYDGNDREHADIIELKQWEKASIVEGHDGVVNTYVGHGYRNVMHPSYQAWSYARMISDYNSSVQDRSIELHPCAYAHNYDTDGTCALKDPVYQEYLDAAPLFGMHDAAKLSAFIKKDIKRGDGRAILEHIDHGRLRPSKSLQDSLSSMLKGNPEFVLIDDQKVFFERAMNLARQARKQDTKIVYIVQGGPGTGKSVISVNMLARLTSEGKVAAYVTQNSAPRSVYKIKLKGSRTKSSIDALFKGSASFKDTGLNVYDALIVDEAHRLVERSQYEKKGSNQIANIIHAARCSIFFIDESQRVKYADYGTIDHIKEFARQAGAEVYEDTLASQFRCNGSDGYLAWLDDSLEVHETANTDLKGINFDFRVFDTPEELEAAIREKNERNKARLVAGYCWEWPKRGRADADHHDIVIGDWSISWNLDVSEPFAIGESSIDQAGCIHTVQGLEFDYVGVIIGPDMRYQNGHIVTDRTKRAKTDASLNGIGKLSEEEARKEADIIIKNTYRTLMTRGMKGCYVYCTDAALRNHLKWKAEAVVIDFDEWSTNMKYDEGQ